MQFINDAIRYQERVGRDIKWFNKQIRRCPKGRLRINKNGTRYKWYVEKDDGKRKYIPKSSEALAISLATKAYYRGKLSELKQEDKLISNFITKYKKINRESDVYFKSPEFSRLLSVSKKLEKSDDEWQNEEYETNPYHPEQLNVRAIGGLFVRSKSEAHIARELTKAKVPFRYECEMILNEQTYYPDFTIRHPVTGELVIWEHFGLMDDEDYVSKAMRKTREYIDNGYLPGHNLILTYETKKHPLDYELVDAYILLHFGDGKIL